jgi:hypothetical protein
VVACLILRAAYPAADALGWVRKRGGRPKIWSQDALYDGWHSHLHDLGSLMPGCAWVVARIRTSVAQKIPVGSAGITPQDFTGLVETPINRPGDCNFTVKNDGCKTASND